MEPEADEPMAADTLWLCGKELSFGLLLVLEFILNTGWKPVSAAFPAVDFHRSHCTG